MMRQLGSYKARVGESPIWHPDEQCIYHIDIKGLALIRTDIADGTQAIWTLPDCPGGIAALPDGGVVVALPSALIAVNANGVMTTVCEFDLLPPGHRFNDATTDTFGRFLVGSCKRDAPRRGEGKLYRIGHEDDHEVLLEGFSLINGLAISGSGDVLYISDSAPDVQTIWTCAYDSASGNVGTPYPIMTMHDSPGRPDGAAIDNEGGYWIAAVDGGALLRIDYSGFVDARLEVPTPKPSKPVFGGSNLDRLFVTTISEGVETEDAAAGHLLELECSWQGMLVQPIHLKNQRK